MNEKTLWAICYDTNLQQLYPGIKRWQKTANLEPKESVPQSHLCLKSEKTSLNLSFFINKTELKIISASGVMGMVNLSQEICMEVFKYSKLHAHIQFVTVANSFIHSSILWLWNKHFLSAPLRHCSRDDKPSPRS